VEKVPLSNDSFERRSEIVIYEPSAGTMFPHERIF
jgi:hypothetical protein